MSYLKNYLVRGEVASLIDIGVFVQGSPWGGEKVMTFVTTHSFTIPVNFAGSEAFAVGTLTGLEDSVVFTIKKNGVSIGTLTFIYEQEEGMFASSSEVIFIDGDTLEIVYQPVLNYQLYDISITIRGEM